MSQIDAELTLLRQRIAVLEEQKRAELSKRAQPLDAISRIIAERTARYDRNRHDKGFPMSRLYDQEQIETLVPIYTLFTTIQERLDALEKKELPSGGQ
jgi:hypothetical protein